MCGICGVVNYRNETLPKCMQERAVKLLKEIESRGKSAWGIYVYNPEFNLYVKEKRDDIVGHLFKMAGSVSSFFKDLSGCINLDGSSIFLAHTRAPTNGSPENNENNHPFMTKDFILAHNGVISNADELKEKYNLQYESECDSAVIVNLIQHFFDKANDIVESIKLTASELSGSYACWLYCKKTHEVYLFRHTNPIHYYIDKRNHCILFASEFSHIDSVYDKKLTYSDVPTLPEDKIFKIIDGEVKYISELKPSISTVRKHKDMVEVEQIGEDSDKDTIEAIRELKLLFDEWLLDNPEDFVSMTLWDDALEIRISSEKLYSDITSHNILKEYIVMLDEPSKSVMMEIFLSELGTVIPCFRYIVHKYSNEKTNIKEEIERFAKFLGGNAIFFGYKSRGNYEEFIKLSFPNDAYVRRLFQQYGLTLSKEGSIKIPIDGGNHAFKSLIKILNTLGFFG